MLTVLRRPVLVLCGLCIVPLGVARTQGLPAHPQNLQVLPQSLSTDSVFNLMLNVADGLGVTCGFCHVGGDNRTWDSTNFAADVKPTKVAARAMFAMLERLNGDLASIVPPGQSRQAITCITCHRGSVRITTIEDTITTVDGRQGVDSAIAAYRRIRERYAGRMTYNLADYPLRVIASRVSAAGRQSDAIAILEEASRTFPNSANTALALGMAYEKSGDPDRALAQYYKALAVEPGNRQALAHLRALLK